MTTLTTMVEGARVTARTPRVFARSLMHVSAVERDGTVVGQWLVPARHWLEDVGPLIVGARSDRVARIALTASSAQERKLACWCGHDRCCRVHKVHVSPHRNCMLR